MLNLLKLSAWKLQKPELLLKLQEEVFNKKPEKLKTELFTKNLASLVHLFYFFTALGFSSFEDDDGTEKAIADFALSLNQFHSTGVEFFELAFALFQLLLLTLQADEFVLALLELCANPFDGTA